MKLRVLFLITITSLLLTAREYVIKKGDTLSEIGLKTIPGDVYGEDGSLRKLIKLNSGIKNPDLIYPNSRIKTLRINEKEVFVSQKNPCNAKFTNRLGVSLSRLSLESNLSRDVSAYALSGASPGVSYRGEYTRCNQLSLIYGIGFKAYDMESSGNRPLKVSKMNASRLMLGSKFKFTKFDIKVSGLYEQRLLIKASSIEKLEVLSLPIPSIEAGINYYIHSSEQANASINAHISLALDVDDYRDGQQFGLGATAQFSKKFEISLLVEHSRAKYRDISAISDEATLTLGYYL